MDQIRLGELCAATSLFTDLGTGQPVEHGLRTCLISMRIAGAMGIDPETMRELYFVALLRFLGCTADTYEAAELFEGDDIGFFSGMAPTFMGSRLDGLRALIATVGATVGYPRGVAAVVKALADQDGPGRLLDAHCEVASELATDMGLPPRVSAALQKGYARWDGLGVPRGVAGEAVPTSIRISIVARDLELWARDFGAERASDVLRERRGHAYDPAVVDAALDIGVEDVRLCGPDLWEQVVELEPAPRLQLETPESVRSALQALGDFADLKAPAFAGHSRRVRAIAADAAAAAGISQHESEVLALAAIVHDVGVVSAPVRAWRTDDPGPADSERARLHPLWSRRLLERVDGFEEIAEVTGRHHERMDGTGFPAGSTGEMGRCAGLLACVELYDEGVGAADDAVVEMRHLEGRGGLAGEDVDAVLTAVGEQRPLVEIERPAGLTEREVDVLRHLARGDTNPQIAERLGISPKTVGTHVEHIYAKAQVRSRAAATLFAVKHGLIG